jgi:NAD(P)-dependent dehydrogenase (short-subunit alcohol dehydrogenase family)
MDVTDEQSVSEGFERCREELGQVTILVNNAGTPGVPLPVASMEPAGWRGVFETNVTGAFLCAREALAMMASENWGRIINVSSAAARHPLIGVYPGVVDTRMQEESRGFGPRLIGEQLHRMFQGYRDFGMLRPPEEPAELISYLCTPAAARLNGHIVRLEQLAALKEEA